MIGQGIKPQDNIKCVKDKKDLGGVSEDISSLGVSNLEGKSLRHIQRFINLQQLFLSGDSIDNFVLSYLKNMPNLKELCLFGCTQITDDGLQLLPKLEKLEKLDLRYCSAITDNGIIYLTKQPNLKEIYLDSCFNLTDGGLKELSLIPKLEVISLMDCSDQISDIGVSYLCNLCGLRGLELPGFAKISNEGIKFIAGKTNRLQELYLRQLADVTDIGISFLESCKSLEKITINDFNRDK